MGVKQEVYEWVQNENTNSLQTSALWTRCTCPRPNSSEDTHEIHALHFHYISIKKQNMLITLAYLRNKH